ncbi:MAG: SlyX family protein [Granulosicoccus sp.]|nr:SlyX family protein [Granulosicoccus sp.]
MSQDTQSQNDARLEAVELKCMDLENSVAELNTVIIRQYQEIDLLKTQLERLRGQISGLDSGNDENPTEPPPPHY